MRQKLPHIQGPSRLCSEAVNKNNHRPLDYTVRPCHQREKVVPVMTSLFLVIDLVPDCSFKVKTIFNSQKETSLEYVSF